MTCLNFVLTSLLAVAVLGGVVVFAVIPLVEHGPQQRSRSITPEVATVSDDAVLDSLRAAARAARTPEEAFRVAIRAVHYARVLDAPTPTAYSGARVARQFLEEVAEMKLGPEKVQSVPHPSKAIRDALSGKKSVRAWDVEQRTEVAGE